MEPARIIQADGWAWVGAREAGGSIKPGAQAPGSQSRKTYSSPRSGRQRIGCRALRGLVHFSYSACVHGLRLSPAVAGSKFCLLECDPGACAPGFMLPPAVAGSFIFSMLVGEKKIRMETRSNYSGG